MKMTRYTHAAVLVEDNGTKIAIDPGEFGAIENLSAVDAILITHDHFDHADHKAIRDAWIANPDIALYGPRSLVDQSDFPVSIVDGGDAFDVKGVHIDVVGHSQAVTSLDDDDIPNVGFIIAGKLLHPGDAFQPVTVDTLLLPMEVPWAKNVDRERALAANPPQRIIPIHDAPLGKMGIEFMEHTLANLAGRIGAEALPLRVGDSANI